ncbi:unnamed protein product [Lampetra planeri]
MSPAGCERPPPALRAEVEDAPLACTEERRRRPAARRASRGGRSGAVAAAAARIPPRGRAPSSARADVPSRPRHGTVFPGESRDLAHSRGR